MARVTVRIQLGETPGSQDYERVCEVSLMRDAFTNLDIPSHDLQGFEQMLCTPHETIKFVKRDRTLIAKELSQRLTEHFMNFFSTLDTCNGYPLEPTNIEKTCPAIGTECDNFICKLDSNGEVAISFCTPPHNPNQYEGNCTQKLCPKVE